MNRINVLVVEDEKLWQDIIREIFSSYNCRIDLAENYVEAKNKLDENSYDIVTLDMALSSSEKEITVTASGGWRLLVSQLTKDFPGTSIFVVSASFGDALERVFQLNREYGVKDFMTKVNFDPERLKRWVDDVRRFKEAGGRPDISTRELLDIYSNRPNLTTQELIEIYKQQLAIQRKNKANAELTKAKYGLDAPVSIINSIEEYENEIERIEEKIAELLMVDS